MSCVRPFTCIYRFSVIYLKFYDVHLKKKTGIRPIRMYRCIGLPIYRNRLVRNLPPLLLVIVTNSGFDYKNIIFSNEKLCHGNYFSSYLNLLILLIMSIFFNIRSHHCPPKYWSKQYSCQTNEKAWFNGCSPNRAPFDFFVWIWNVCCSLTKNEVSRALDNVRFWLKNDEYGRQFLHFNEKKTLLRI